MKIKLNFEATTEDYKSIGIMFPDVDNSKLNTDTTYDGIPATNRDGSLWYFLDSGYGYPASWFDVIPDK